MKLTKNQIHKIAVEIYKSLESNSSITLHIDKEKCKELVYRVISKNLEQEKALEAEVNTMMDNLEKQNPGSFERYKMYPLLKKKLAEQKGFVL